MAWIVGSQAKTRRKISVQINAIATVRDIPDFALLAFFVSSSAVLGPKTIASVGILVAVWVDHGQYVPSKQAQVSVYSCHLVCVICRKTDEESGQMQLRTLYIMGNV